MVLLVERMLELHRKKADERNPETLRRLEADIAVTDRQIDRLVYELYSLTPAEIAIVEGGDAREVLNRRERREQRHMALLMGQVFSD